MNYTDLKDLIKSKGRSQTWIAKQLNIPYITFSAYMNEYRTMPIDLPKKVKELL